MELRDLPGTIGTEVAGMPSSADDVDALRDALDRRHLLVLRGHSFTGEAQVAFAARFGPLLPEGGLWNYVSNVHPEGIIREGALLYHSDLAFTRSPVDVISLHALESPDDGAPTLFADAVAAAAALPRDLRSRLDGLRVLNAYDFRHPDDRPMKVSDIDPRSPRWEHPVLARHPRTPASTLMASELHTDSLIGVPRAESDALLADVFAVLYDRGNVYEHRWANGDLVLWDNRAIQHARPNAPGVQARTLQRVTLGSHTITELVPQIAELYG